MFSCLENHLAFFVVVAIVLDLISYLDVNSLYPLVQRLLPKTLTMWIAMTSYRKSGKDPALVEVAAIVSPHNSFLLDL